MRIFDRWLWSAFVLCTFQLSAAMTQAANELARPIRVSPDGHFLIQPDGQPFFWLGDTGWAIFTRLTREEADHYLRDRASKGFTVIQAVAAGSPFDDFDVPNRYGALPFRGKDPSQPNPAYFDHVDWVVQKAASYGVRFALVPVWGYTQITEKEIFSAPIAREYGRWIAHRLRDKGVIWVLGGDTNPIMPSSTAPRQLISVVDKRAIYDAMAMGIADGAGEDPFITYHPAGGSVSGTARPRTSLYLSDRPWLDMNMVCSMHVKNTADWLKKGNGDFVFDATKNYEPVLEEYRSMPVRPVIDGEARFEDLAIDLDETGARGFWSGYDARNAAYHAVFAGAAGHTYGNHYVWQYYTTRSPSFTYELPPKKLEWREALERPVSNQLRHLKSLILSRPYFSRVPDQSLIAGDAGEGVAHISATRDSLGDYAMIYLPHGQTVAINSFKLSGRRLIAWWYDPRTGAATRVSHEIPRTGAVTMTPPSSGLESDWVLIIDNESRDFPAPGRAQIENPAQVTLQ